MQIMNRTSQSRSSSHSLRRGFTLVEMLVALALVLLMMAMFAQIFATATDSLATQKGIAENDQRARRLQTTLATDLELRLYRALPGANGIMPLWAVPDPTIYTDYPHPEYQRGYFHYAENDPDNDTDDCLQFMIASRDALPADLVTEPDEQPSARFFGKATYIIDPAAGVPETMVDQPVADDGTMTWDIANGLTISPTTNTTGSSPAAEVCYFLRNGNLYRRILLVRSPLVENPALTPSNLSGSASPGGNLGYGGNPDNPLEVNYYTDFDFSAYHDPADDMMKLLEANVDPAAPNPPVWLNDVAVSMGIPKFRFGFFGNIADPADPGIPVEFLPNAAGATPNVFIGRFTHAETSNINFSYPGRAVDTADAAFNPYTDTIFDQARGVVTEAAAATFDLVNGPRRGEDLMLSNVHSFNVEVFDNELGEFVDLGHSRTDALGMPTGHYNDSRNTNANFGRRFDTWHADSDLIGPDPTPFQPVGPDLQPGVALADDDTNGTIDDASELGWPGSDDMPPLTAIRITIRYLDVTSDQMRDLTIIHSFADRDSQ